MLSDIFYIGAVLKWKWSDNVMLHSCCLVPVVTYSTSSLTPDLKQEICVGCRMIVIIWSLLEALQDQLPCMPVIQHVRSPANAAKIFPSICVCVCVFSLLQAFVLWMIVLLCCFALLRRHRSTKVVLGIYVWRLFFCYLFTGFDICKAKKDCQNYSCSVPCRPCNQTNPYCSPNF